MPRNHGRSPQPGLGSSVSSGHLSVWCWALREVESGVRRDPCSPPSHDSVNPTFMSKEKVVPTLGIKLPMSHMGKLRCGKKHESHRTPVPGLSVQQNDISTCSLLSSRLQQSVVFQKEVDTRQPLQHADSPFNCPKSTPAPPSLNLCLGTQSSLLLPRALASSPSSPPTKEYSSLFPCTFASAVL